MLKFPRNGNFVTWFPGFSPEISPIIFPLRLLWKLYISIKILQWKYLDENCHRGNVVFIYETDVALYNFIVN